jgi:hypothetical protein
MERALCPLCKKAKDIADGHLIPKAVYPYCRDPQGNTIVINPDFLGFSDRQIHTPLLCFDCEDILNKGGEGWLMPLLAEYDARFPFYDILTQKSPDGVDGNATAYAAARNDEIKCEKLAHFAMPWVFFGRQRFIRGGVEGPSPSSSSGPIGSPFALFFSGSRLSRPTWL